MGSGVQMFKCGYFDKEFKPRLLHQIGELYKLFNIQQLNKNGINMQDAKNVFYMYEKKCFLYVK